MTLRARRIIYLAFILIFTIITPTIVFYTVGYRYNFKKNKIQKTGILILNSKPKEAKIYLNDRLRKEKTPAKITNLLPDEYFIKIEKENFHPWQKKLTVESNLTTFAEDIILFKRSLPSEIKISQINSAPLFAQDNQFDRDFEKNQTSTTSKINLISLSPDEKKLAYTLNLEHGKEIWILTLNNKKEQLIYRTSNENKIDFLEWDPASQKILITIMTSDNFKKYLIFDLENPEKISLYSRLQDFYFQFKNIKNKETPVNFANYNLIEGSNQFVTLIDRESQTLLIIDPKTNEKIFETKAKGGQWFSDGGKLLFFNDFELWIYNLASNEKKVITRYSKEILDAEWYLNSNYILLLTNNTIKSIEIDSRYVRNIVDLVKMDEIFEFEINKKEEVIYLLGKIGKKSGIYELELK